MLYTYVYVYIHKYTYIRTHQKTDTAQQGAELGSWGRQPARPCRKSSAGIPRVRAGVSEECTGLPHKKKLVMLSTFESKSVLFFLILEKP